MPSASTKSQTHSSLLRSSSAIISRRVVSARALKIIARSRMRLHILAYANACNNDLWICSGPEGRQGRRLGGIQRRTPEKHHPRR